jgi:hypothetical protein
VSASHTDLSDAELMGLLKVARTNNARNDLTGFLLYCERNFIQLLEGDKNRVETLFQLILRDIRHKNIIRLFSGYVEKRDFPDWSMGFQRIDKSNLSVMEGGNLLLDASSLADAQLKDVSRHVRLFIRTFRHTSRIE